jgi:signal transduction histidine kinase
MSVEIVDIAVSINKFERGICRLCAYTSRLVHVIDVDALSKIINLVLMNLIGNAVKFTARGYVLVNCSVEESISEPGDVNIKFEIRQVFCCNRSRPSQ